MKSLEKLIYDAILLNDSRYNIPNRSREGFAVGSSTLPMVRRIFGQISVELFSKNSYQPAFFSPEARKILSVSIASSNAGSALTRANTIVDGSFKAMTIS